MPTLGGIQHQANFYDHHLSSRIAPHAKGPVVDKVQASCLSRFLGRDRRFESFWWQGTSLACCLILSWRLSMSLRLFLKHLSKTWPIKMAELVVDSIIEIAKWKSLGPQTAWELKFRPGVNNFLSQIIWSNEPFDSPACSLQVVGTDLREVDLSSILRDLSEDSFKTCQNYLRPIQKCCLWHLQTLSRSQKELQRCPAPWNPRPTRPRIFVLGPHSLERIGPLDDLRAVVFESYLSIVGCSSHWRNGISGLNQHMHIVDCYDWWLCGWWWDMAKQLHCESLQSQGTQIVYEQIIASTETIEEIADINSWICCK